MSTSRIKVEIYQLKDYRNDHWGAYTNEPVTDPDKFDLVHTSEYNGIHLNTFEILQKLWSDMNTWSRFDPAIHKKYGGNRLLTGDVVAVKGQAFVLMPSGWQPIEWESAVEQLGA